MAEATGNGLWRAEAPKRIILRNPVREFCTPGSVRGQSGNWLSYLDPQNYGSHRFGGHGASDRWPGDGHQGRDNGPGCYYRLSTAASGYGCQDPGRS